MKAVIIAGGEGSRLRPLTIGRPKPMVPIVNQPILAHILALLKSHGINEVVITLRYMASIIQNFFEDGAALGMKISYMIEDAPLGTAGSVKNAARLLDDDTFLVISGDALTDIDLSSAVAAHKERGAMASMVLSRVERPLEYGVVILNDQSEVIQLLEKPGWNEVISDTVNTGIYLLEPTIFDLIPDHTLYDFSNDLFPVMLEKKHVLHGTVMGGYWCDIGTIQEYMRANSDLLAGRVRIPQPIGRRLGGNIWAGGAVEIADNAQLFGPIYLGNEVKIKGDVTIYGPAVVRDYTVIDNYNRIEHSMIWRNSYVGEACEIQGAVICRQCSIKSSVTLFEGVVVGDNTILGEGSVLHGNVKIWPNKEIEAGARVNESIVWGNQGRRTLFGGYGISGVVNVDLTPEFVAKLGAALGGTLPRGSYAVLNRDGHRASRMLKRALISALPGTGINVLDLGTVPIPVLRHFVRNHQESSAGIHVRLSPFDQRVVDIRFLDQAGMNQDNSTERSIERSFFREDFRRAFLDQVGLIEYARGANRAYQQDFLDCVDSETIRRANFRLVVDYSHGLASETLAEILTQLGVDVVPLNERMNEKKLAMLQHEFLDNRQRVAKIVSALGAHLGVQLDVGGEKLFIIANDGEMLENVKAALLMSELTLYANQGNKQPLSLAAAVTMPNALQTIAGWHNARLTYTRSSLHHLM